MELGQRVRKIICGNNDAVQKRERVIVEQSPDRHIPLHPTPPRANLGVLGANWQYGDQEILPPRFLGPDAGPDTSLNAAMYMPLLTLSSI